MKAKTRQDYRQRRRWHIRKRISGTPERPRMAVMVSNRQIMVQFIDDVAAVTLAAASSSKSGRRLTVETARDVGRQAAEAALSKGIRRAVVDRGGFRYHGRVKALVETVEISGVSVGCRVTAADEGEGTES